MNGEANMLNIELHTVLNDLISRLETKIERETFVSIVTMNPDDSIHSQGMIDAFGICQDMIKDVLRKLVEEDAAALVEMSKEESGRCDPTPSDAK